MWSAPTACALTTAPPWRGEWRIGEAASQIGENLARSEHFSDKIKNQERWPNTLFAFDGPEFVLVQRRTAVAYASTRQRAMDRLAWFSGKFKSAAAPETTSFHIINMSYGSLRAERVEVALNFAPQESNLHWLLLRIFNDGPCTAGHHADGEYTAGGQDQPQPDDDKGLAGKKGNTQQEKQEHDQGPFPRKVEQAKGSEEQGQKEGQVY